MSLRRITTILSIFTHSIYREFLGFSGTKTTKTTQQSKIEPFNYTRSVT